MAESWTLTVHSAKGDFGCVGTFPHCSPSEVTSAIFQMENVIAETFSGMAITLEILLQPDKLCIVAHLGKDAKRRFSYNLTKQTYVYASSMRSGSPSVSAEGALNNFVSEGLFGTE